jgi:phosphoribosyl 1,2-cyclic phosphate phosphodiesterase
VKVTILGSGTSQGIPVIACECDVCQSNDSLDKRLRSSVLINAEENNYVIDTGPDFRQQMLRHKVKQLKSVLFTHEHKDHLAGLDDVRPFNYMEDADMDIFCSDQVAKAIKNEFHYVFSEKKYPGTPRLNIQLIKNEPFKLTDGPMVIPIQVYHHKMPVFGFRIADFTYITDAKTIDDIEIEKVRGSKILIVNALHKSQHLSHFNLEEALAFIAQVKPEQAYLTHISHLFGKHKEIEASLPKGVNLAYDGLSFEI